MSDKPLTPYARLLQQVQDFRLRSTRNPHKRLAVIPKDKLEQHGAAELYQKVKTAADLGHEVVLVATSDGLHIDYRQKLQVPVMR